MTDNTSQFDTHSPDDEAKGRKAIAVDVTHTASTHKSVVHFNPVTHAPLACWCIVCNPSAGWMVVCPDCGNKRCPHATSHDHACTKSNEPDQPGSVFSDDPGVEIKSNRGAFWADVDAAIAEGKSAAQIAREKEWADAQAMPDNREKRDLQAQMDARKEREARENPPHNNTLIAFLTGVLATLIAAGIYWSIVA